MARGRKKGRNTLTEAKAVQGRERTNAGQGREMAKFRLGYHTSRFRSNLIILPIGLYYNREIRKIKPGDYVEFSDGVERRVEFALLMPIHGALTEYLCRKTYTGAMQVVMKRWYANALMEGFGRDVIDTEQCLMIFFERETNDKKWEV